MKNFLLGLGFGVAAGLMIAPFSGSKTRRGLRDRASRMKERLSSQIGLQQRASDIMDRVPRDIDEQVSRLTAGLTESRQQPAKNQSSQQTEEHFGIEHPRGMGLVQGGRPADEHPPADAPRGEQALLEVLNNCTRDELTSVNGIGLVLARRIIRHRPYNHEQDVFNHGVLTEEQLHLVRRELVEKRRIA